MKIAYIVDATTKYKEKNVFTIPFNTYEPSGNMVKIYDSNMINRLIEESKDGVKSFVEPTPGMYRDMFLYLYDQGYDHIIVLPCNKNYTNSYQFAKYAEKRTNVNIDVIDVSEFNENPETILNYILHDEQSTEVIESVGFDISVLLNVLSKAFNSLRLSA